MNSQINGNCQNLAILKFIVEDNKNSEETIEAAYQRKERYFLK